MFLNLLDSDEKRAFAELAERMIAADGLVIGRERAAIAALKAEMGAPAPGSTGGSVASLAGVFRSRRSRVAALLELIGLGYSDTDFSVNEKSLVTEVARHMGLTAADLTELEGWVTAHVNLVRRALVLMRE